VYKWLSLLLLLTSAWPHSAWAYKDPTRPSSYADTAVANNSLRLDSILTSDNRRVAVINGVAVAEGDRMGEVRVVSIEKGVVRVNRNGEILQLELAHPSIRREP
jgi:MSHA biogenesis protein MshK